MTSLSKYLITTTAALALSGTLIGCNSQNPSVNSVSVQPSSSELSLDAESYELSNGLSVVLHVDKSEILVTAG